ncbi:MAG: amidohydrolase [Firmicutes bacterium]|nr:amidohydrolase [Bacillota bacterium]
MKLMIKNAQIKSMYQEDFVGDLLINGEKIAAMGKDLLIDEQTEVIDAAGYLLTPGLIDGHCHIGIMEEGIGFEGDDINEISDPVTPHLRAIDGINPMTPEFQEALAGGVTLAMIGPGSANVMGGQFALVKMAGKCIDRMVIKEPAAMKIAFGENPKTCYGKDGKMPVTRMGIAGLLRKTLYDGKQYKEKKEKGEDQAFDLKLESLLPVLSGEILLKAHAHQADDIFTAIRIAKEFHVELTLDHCTEGHLIAEELAEAGYPVFLGPTFGGKSKYELRNMSFSTAKILYEKGISFAIVTDAYVIPLKHLSLCAALAVGAGLPEETGWRSITLTPAEILGISERCGSLQPGKDADMVLFDGNPLRSIDAKAVLTIVNGKPVYSDGSLWERV